MVKIDNITENSPLSIDCNSLVLKNNGSYECRVTFNSTGTTLTVSKSQIIYVFNTLESVIDNLFIGFVNPFDVSNELEIIQTKYDSGGSANIIESIDFNLNEERTEYVSVVSDENNSSIFELSKYTSGTGTITTSLIAGLRLSGSTSDVCAIQTKKNGGYNAGNIYGGWIEVANTLNIGCITEFGLGNLSSNIPHEINEGVFFRISGTEESLNIQAPAIGNFITILRASWYDKLDGTGPSGLVYDFTSHAQFYFEYVYSTNKANVYIAFDGKTALVNTIVINTTMFTNPRQPVFLRVNSKTAINFNVYFFGCSIYRKGGNEVVRRTGYSTLNFVTPSADMNVSFETGYLGLAFWRLERPSGGYDFFKLKDFQVFSDSLKQSVAYLVINPTFSGELDWNYAYGTEGVSQTPNLLFARGNGSIRIINYEYCIALQQYAHNSDIVKVVDEILGNEIDSNPQILAIMVQASTENQVFRVSANIEQV